MKQIQKLSQKQERAIIELISGASPSFVCESLKISRATLFRWRNQPLFQERWRELRALAVESAIARLQTLTEKAVDAIDALLDSTHAPTAARVAIATLRESRSSIEEFDTRAKVLELWREHQREKRP